jgi:hypothetical protein
VLPCRTLIQFQGSTYLLYPTTMEILYGLIGSLLGIVLGRTKLGLLGALLSTYLGGAGIIGYSVGRLLITTGRDYIDLCDEGDVIKLVEVKSLVLARATFLIAGLLMAWGLGAIGWQGLGAAGSIGFTLLAILITVGTSTNFICLFMLVVIFCTCSKYIGLANAPIIALMFLTSLPERPGLSRLQQMQELEFPVANASAWLNGILVGIVPGLGTGLLVRSQVNAWSVIAMAEGIAIGTNLFLKSSGKSATGALLAQFAPSLDAHVGAVVICICVCLCCCNNLIKLAMLTVELPEPIVVLSNCVAFAWLLSIPDNVVLTFLWATGLGVGTWLVSKVAIWLPHKFASGLAAAPLLSL